MNIYLHELRAYRKSTIIWTVSLVGITVLFMSIFPAIVQDFETFQKLLNGFPDEVKKAFGIEVESFGTVLGFYAYTFLYLMLCGAIQAMNIGTSIVSKEVRDKTADFLMTKPVSRMTILTSKILAAATAVLLTNALFIAASAVMVNIVKTDEFSAKAYVLVSLTLLFVQLIFLALGILLSVVVRKIKSALTVSLGTVFAFFIIGMLAATSDDPAKRYLSPFQYFNAADIVRNTQYETPYVLTGIGIVIVSLAVSYIVYIKKDIHAV